MSYSPIPHLLPSEVKDGGNRPENYTYALVRS